MNHAFLIGRLTRDPEQKTFDSGKTVTNFTLAVNRGFGKDNDTDFINCTAWDALGSNLCQYQGKGSQVAVHGRMQVRSYDKDGSKVYITEVVCNSIEYLGGMKEKPQGHDDGLPDFEALDDLDEDDMPF